MFGALKVVAPYLPVWAAKKTPDNKNLAKITWGIGLVWYEEESPEENQESEPNIGFKESTTYFRIL